MRLYKNFNTIKIVLWFSLGLYISVANAIAVTDFISGDTVRILLLDGVQKVEVGATVDIIIFDSEKELIEFEPADPVIIHASGSGFSINGKRINYSSIRIFGATISEENKFPLISVNSRKYRGELLLINKDGAITVINVLDIEEYLCGVLPREMPENWHMEALKAQAVAARTFTLNCLESRKSKNRTYDMKCTIADQVYGGYKDEKPRCDSAISATRGEILVYDNKPILAVYHSNSGGMTENDADVFGTHCPYLQSHPDDYAASAPGYAWAQRLAAEEVRTRLMGNGLILGRIEDIKLNKVDESGRVREIAILHSNGNTKLSGVAFRNKMGTTFIKSTLFTIQKEGNRYFFSGKGYGHGVGMSQSSAKKMAEQGIGYQEILAKFYPGANLVKR
jgi:stage II sporulation protein D